MKLVITKTREGTVCRVGSLNQLMKANKNLKTEDEVFNAIDSGDKECGYERYSVLDATGDNEEVFAFLIGENGYKATYDIEDLCDRLDGVSDAVENVASDIYDIQETVNTIKSLADKFKEKYADD
jgi:hypothetical protein